MLCLRLAFILGVATLALADVDVTTPLSPSTPPELPIGADLVPQYEDLSDKQQPPSTPPPAPSTLNVGDTLWTCDCAFKEFLDYVRTKSSQDAATEIPEIRCQGPEGHLEVWSDAAALKYCPDQYDDSSSEEYDDEYEDIFAEEDTDVADQDAVLKDDLPKEDAVQRLEQSELVSDAVTEDVDVTLDVDYSDDEDEEIVVLYGFPPAFVLVLLLAAFTVVALGVAVTVCRALARSDPGRQGWATLNEEGGDAAYVKVPLE